MVDSAVLKTAPGPWSGWLNGLLGVIIFSGSLPATRLAVLDMDPFLLTFLRASIAGLLAIALLAQILQKRINIIVAVPFCSIIIYAVFNIMTFFGVPSGTLQDVFLCVFVIVFGVAGQRGTKEVVK